MAIILFHTLNEAADFIEIFLSKLTESPVVHMAQNVNLQRKLELQDNAPLTHTKIELSNFHLLLLLKATLEIFYIKLMFLHFRPSFCLMINERHKGNYHCI